MILRAPTGLYEKHLPTEPSDSSPVTWSISNKNPPPIPLVQTVVAPQSIVFAPEPPSVENREDYGELVFSVVVGRRSTTGSNKKAFEVGDVIYLEDDDDLISPTIPINQLTIQHNTNVLDLESLGLTEEEITAIDEQSNVAIEEKRDEVASLQTQVSDLQIAIRENQKFINECVKAIKAVTVTFSDETDNGIIDKLNTKLENLKAERTSLNEQIETKAAALTTAQDEFIDLSQVVR